MNPLEIIDKKLEDKKHQLVDFLTSGGATDHAHYMGIVGEIKGLGYAQIELADMHNLMIKQDDNDN